MGDTDKKGREGSRPGPTSLPLRPSGAPVSPPEETQAFHSTRLLLEESVIQSGTATFPRTEG